MSGWALSIDVGTTATAAAVAVDGERRTIELDGRSRMPSTVLAPVTGPLVVGEAAEAQAALEPERVERTPKRRLGDPVILLGDRAVDPVDAIAAILAHVAATATAGMGGVAPDQLVLTHPAPWGSSRLDLLRDAAGRAGLPEPVLVPEPVAAAAHLAADLASPGDILVVYDLGGGTFDAAIVRRTETGFVVAGPPGGDDSLGGEALDELVVTEVLGRLDPDVANLLGVSEERVWRQARVQLQRDARAAKEALSTSASYRWYLGPPVDTELSLTATRLVELISGSIAASVASLLDTIHRAGLSPQHLQAVVMVGGCARAPIVGQMLAQATGRAPTTWGDPKAAVSLGALRVAAAEADIALSVPVPAPPAAVEPEEMAAPIAEPVDDRAEMVTENHREAAAPGVDHQAGEPAAGEAAPPEWYELTPPGAAAMPPTATRGPDDGDGTVWDRERIGMLVATVLVALGVVFAVLAFVVR